MKNPLAAHPPWRQLLIVSIVLPLLIALAVLAFAWPAARMRPRNVPVGIVGSTPGSEQLLERLSAAQPGAFDFRLYADRSAARAAVADRDVYGAFVVTAHRISVLEASASSPAMAQVLDTVGRSLTADQSAPAGGTDALQIVDVVPLARDDPRGAVFAASLLPLTICSILVAAAVGVVVRFRPAWRQLVALSVLSAMAGLGSYLIAQGFLGALPNQPLATWAGLSLTILAISASTSGLIALVGPLGLGLAAVLMVFIGNPFSGVTSAPELLPDWVRLVGQWLPPGAGANLLRSSAYFGGDGAAAHLGVLVVWAALGFAAIILGHHSPIRFAADPAGWRASTPQLVSVSPAMPRTGAARPSEVQTPG
ncbi:MAG TPA: ABC transporter permease [Jatrophihabitantaceae bacterium]|nr:ABC transporter permease [Jatrophihabitantaceae bacterium]